MHSQQNGIYSYIRRFQFSTYRRIYKINPFCQIHGLKTLINEPTCYKNPNNPIDLVTTNMPKIFETKLWDFHKMIFTALKVSFRKKPRVLNYRKYKFYDNNIFREQFLTKLDHVYVSKQDNSLKGFQEKCLTVLNSMANKTLIYTTSTTNTFYG